MSDPIIIGVRDTAISEMASDMTVANGYFFDMGSVDVYERANASFPRTLIKLGEETSSQDFEAHGADLYHNSMEWEIIGDLQDKNAGDRNQEFDWDKEIQKLIEDYKKFFGVKDRLAAAGVLNIFYLGSRHIVHKDLTFPISVISRYRIDYRQRRQNPQEGG